MIFFEVGLLGLNSTFGSKKATFFSIVLKCKLGSWTEKISIEKRKVFRRGKERKRKKKLPRHTSRHSFLFPIESPQNVE